MPLQKLNIAYFHDSATLFATLRDKHWAIFLDSGQTINADTGNAGSQFGRYDILVADPFITVITNADKTEIRQNGQLTVTLDDPFYVLNQLLKKYAVEKSAVNKVNGEKADGEKADGEKHKDDDKFNVPFSGGALGYFGYDLGRRVEKIACIAAPSQAMPDMMIGFYDWAVVVDHREKCSFLVSNCINKSTQAELLSLQVVLNDAIAQALQATSVLVSKPSLQLTSPQNDDMRATFIDGNDFVVTSPIQSNLSNSAYEKAFNQVKAYITAGDCYQVNLAQRFSATVQGDSWQAYKTLRHISPAPFMAYMQLTNHQHAQFQVLCNSPERFLQTDGSHVETRPIKGTRPRSTDPTEDLALANELQNSLKDRAENVMIVDLLRNDLGKNCEIGSIKATQLFNLQSFANVHHLVSIVVGKVKQGANAVDILRGAFPGGSITGAPKLRAMQIIEELEPNRRGLYCGAIGYIGFDGKMDTNIAIRTATIAKDNMTFYAGGGLVADSELNKEYNEIVTKAASFIKIIKLYTRL